MMCPDLGDEDVDPQVRNERAIMEATVARTQIRTMAAFYLDHNLKAGTTLPPHLLLELAHTICEISGVEEIAAFQIRSLATFLSDPTNSAPPTTPGPQNPVNVTTNQLEQQIQETITLQKSLSAIERVKSSRDSHSHRRGRDAIDLSDSSHPLVQALSKLKLLPKLIGEGKHRKNQTDVVTTVARDVVERIIEKRLGELDEEVNADVMAIKEILGRAGFEAMDGKT